MTVRNPNRSFAPVAPSVAPSGRGSGRLVRLLRTFAFQAGHIPIWRGSCGSYALSLVTVVSGWLLLLLSAVSPGPHLRGLPGAVTAPCSAQTPPPNPIAAESCGSRVLSGGGGADHAVTPQAPLTGSGCREHSYGGFGGGHTHTSTRMPPDLRHTGNMLADAAITRLCGRRLQLCGGRATCRGAGGCRLARFRFACASTRRRRGQQLS